MKRFLLILSLLLVTGTRLFAQEDDDKANEKIQDKMNEYIQKKLNLSKDEAAKFTPVFLRYFKEWRQTLKDNRDLPALDRQQKIIDLRIRYRTEFRQILGERFIRELRDLLGERRGNNPRPLRKP
jgi:hypothetical protein